MVLELFDLEILVAWICGFVAFRMLVVLEFWWVFVIAAY